MELLVVRPWVLSAQLVNGYLFEGKVVMLPLLSVEGISIAIAAQHLR